jgi:hypothetical protein
MCAAPAHGVAVSPKPNGNTHCKHCYAILDTRARKLALRSERLSVLRAPGRKTAARDDPKCRYYRLYRPGVFVPMVANSIQDMSEVSITHQTVGIRLPRLWRGAIGWRNPSREEIPRGLIRQTIF